MNFGADRNLLFGILALQLDFITRDQLVEGMHAWVMHKDHSLGSLLVERGALAVEDFAVLAPMVERHIVKHGGAAKSLAALGPAVLERNALGAVADGEVHESLALLADRKERNELPLTSGYQPGSFTAPRYVIERPHARGGIGEVFVAHDSELNRRVALKHIQHEYADDPASQSLFLVEGEITGALEHPGIIPVYGLGRYSNGRPFYAMRFVEGKNFNEVIAEFHDPATTVAVSARNLAFHELLGHFLNACSAIAYAHHRGILHRDLKPGNILIGEFGETLVIDWGMAKVLGKPEGDCQPPRPEGCPTVSAPPARWAEPLAPLNEALATVGRGTHGTPGYMSPEQAGGRIGELGAATDIYSLGAILFHILTGRPPLTARDGDVLGRTIRGELPRPGELKEDLPPRLEKACMKALSLDPGARFESVSALAAEVRQWLADEDERTRLANERFTLALEAYQKLVIDADRLLRSHPGMHGLRRELLSHAVLGLKQLVQGTEKGENADSTRAVAHSVLGDIYLQADGQAEKALREYQTGFDLMKRLAEADPKDALAQRGLSISHNKLGDVLLQQGEVQKALEHYQDGLKISRSLAEGGPEDARAQRELSVSHEKLGDALLQQGEVQKALQYYQDGLTISRRLADADSKDRQTQRDLSISHIKLGDVLLQQGEGHKALEQYQEGLRIGTRLAETGPKDAQAQRDLFVLHIKLGDVLLQQGEEQKALEQYQESLKISKHRTEADPNDLGSQRDLFVSHIKLGDVLLQQGEVQTALEQYQDGLAIRRRLADADPNNFEAQTDLFVSWFKLGRAEKQAGRHEKAAEAFDRGAAVLQPLEEAGQLKGTRFASWPGMAEAEIRFCRAAVCAMESLSAALKQPGELVFSLAAERCRVLAMRGQAGEAAAAAEELAERARAGDDYFQAARGFARCAAVMAAATEQEQHAGRAVELLGKARDAGAFKVATNAAELTTSRDFAPLRQRDDFKKLLAELERPRL